MTMTSPHTSNRHGIRTAIESELTTLFQARTREANTYGDAFARLWTLAGSSMLGGKLVRPMLLVESYHALTAPEGADSSDAARRTTISIASAVELLHYSFLLHDDVIDGDLIRRGRPNLIGALLEDSSTAPTWSAPDHRAPSPDARLHWARAGGILMGNLLLSSTHQTFARAELPAADRTRLLDLLDETITESVAGEQLDVGLGDGIIEPELVTILAMCAYKTATYSFELPLRVAAILAGVSTGLERVLTAAGRHLGLAFQLQDDLLSTFGNPVQHGKDPFSDLREGKQTTLIAYARNTSAWPQIAATLGNPELSERDGMELRGLLSRCGAEAFVRSLVDDQMRAFSELLERSHPAIPSEARIVLDGLAAQLEGRRS